MDTFGLIRPYFPRELTEHLLAMHERGGCLNASQQKILVEAIMKPVWEEFKKESSQHALEFFSNIHQVYSMANDSSVQSEWVEAALSAKKMASKYRDNFSDLKSKKPLLFFPEKVDEKFFQLLSELDLIIEVLTEKGLEIYFGEERYSSSEDFSKKSGSNGVDIFLIRTLCPMFNKFFKKNAYILVGLTTISLTGNKNYFSDKDGLLIEKIESWVKSNDPKGGKIQRKKS